MKIENLTYLLSIILIIFLVSSCCEKSETVKSESVENIPEVVFDAPEWSNNATIYEVNLRQYTPEGTINAFVPYIQKLKNLGIDILWIMPPYPIGKEKRKGLLGSPYSIKDYTAINPDLGTLEDFKRLVDKAHSLDMKVILDWVGNHSSFDHDWATKHPNWYTKDSLGEITHPKGTDWTDVADLNYDNKDMRKAMIEALKFWVEKYDIDGYRCDVAGFVPYDFWGESITELHKIKKVFMLAEWEDAKLHKAGFNMTYGWEFHHILNEIAKGKMTALSIDTFLTKDLKAFGKDAYRMNFTTNHDENSWNGTIKERMGDAGDALTVLAYTVQGMPLVYSGQEAGLDKRLSFFGKDTIDWSDMSKSVFYKRLLDLNHTNKALWNGSYGGVANKIKTNNDDVYLFSRTKEEDKVVVLLNLSKVEQEYKTSDKFQAEEMYQNIFTSEKKKFGDWIKDNQKLSPWSFLVLEKV